MYTSKTRTVLLCAFAFITSLVIWRAAQGVTDGPANHEAVGEKDEVHVIVEHRAHKHNKRHKHTKRHKHHKRHVIDADEMAAHIEAGLEEAARHLEELDLENLGEEIEAGLEEAARELERLDIDIDAEFGASSVRIKGRKAEGEVMIEERYDVREGGTLRVNVPGADVEVLPGSNDQAEVTVYLEGRDMDKARTYFESLNFEVYQKGDVVAIEAESKNKKWGWNSWKRNGGARILVKARIPERFNTDLKTSGGDVTVIRLEGRTELSTSGGDVTLGTLSGPTILARTSGGDIKAESVRGDAAVELKTSGGDLALGDISGATLHIQTSGGDVKANHLTGETIKLGTSGGDIYLKEVDGDLTARTSGGDINIQTLAGDVVAGTSGGDIEVRLERTSAVELKTSGGSIDITAPAALEANLELKGGRVQVADAFQFAGTMKKNRAQGALNGGGPRLYASTSGGKITLNVNR